MGLGEEAWLGGSSIVKSETSWVMVTWDFPPVDGQTDMTEIITFPQLRWQEAIIHNNFCRHGLLNTTAQSLSLGLANDTQEQSKGKHHIVTLLRMFNLFNTFFAATLGLLWIMLSSHDAM